MAGRSCLTNLLETLESWTKALDDGFGIDVLYLDYRKAFDSVSHKRLLDKLKLSGIDQCETSTMAGIVSNRKVTESGCEGIVFKMVECS